MPSSTRVKYPENYRKRRLWFRLANPVKQTTRQILAPELPFSLQKRATARSHDTHSASSDVLSHAITRKVDEPDGDDDEEDNEKVEPQIHCSAFFIPGITGRARCLQAEQAVAKGYPIEPIYERAPVADSSNAPTKLPETSNNSRQSRGRDRSQRRSSTGMEQTNLLYGEVVDSIQARRDEGSNGLCEEDFQRMLSLLETNDEPTLRNQVSSIRTLLSDYERKKVLKKRKHKKSGSI